MTTFTSPLRVRTPDGTGTDQNVARALGENFMGGFKFGYAPQVFPVYLSSGEFAIASGTPAVTKTYIIPAGEMITDVYVDIKTAFAGTSLAAPTFNVGVGAQAAALMTNVNAVNLGRKTFLTNGVSAGVSLLNNVLTADTTLTLTVSVSGTAAQGVGPLSAGDMTFCIVLG